MLIHLLLLMFMLIYATFKAVTLPSREIKQDGKVITEYHDSNVLDCSLRSLLSQSYDMFRVLHAALFPSVLDLLDLLIILANAWYHQQCT